jgi:hypothetical protein
MMPSKHQTMKPWNIIFTTFFYSAHGLLFAYILPYQQFLYYNLADKNILN